MNTAPINLHITTTVSGERRVLGLSGRLDAHQVGALLEAAEPLSPTTRLDMQGVTFMDSSGLASLVRLNRAARAQGARLEIAGVRDAVRLAMEITGLYALLPVVHGGPDAGDAAHGSV